MNELDFSDKPVNYLPKRIAPAVKCGQTKSFQKKPIYTPTRLRDIENRLEEMRLENELSDIYDY